MFYDEMTTRKTWPPVADHKNVGTNVFSFPLGNESISMPVFCKGFWTNQDEREDLFSMISIRNIEYMKTIVLSVFVQSSFGANLSVD